MIYVNGRFLTQNLTGVQRFAYEISRGLNSLFDDIIFLVPDLSELTINDSRDGFKIVEVKGRKGHLWEQITLPLFLKKNKSPLLINLCNTAPAIYKNQIVTHHDITYVRYPESYPKKFRYFYKTLTSCIVKRSKAVITVSEFSKKEISKYYNCPKEKIHVIYNAANDNFHESTIEQSGGYLLAVGSVNYHKNIHGLIKAFSSTNIDIELKIIGGKNKVFSSVDIDDNDPRVKFLGRVDDSELISLYQNAKAFVFPSFYEGFGIPPLEAQACGCPVISSNTASLPEVLDNSALFFNPESEDEIIESLKRIVSDNELRNTLISKGKSNVARFSWDVSAEKIGRIVKGIQNN